MVWSLVSSFPWFFLFRRNRAMLVLISGGWFSLLKHFLGDVVYSTIEGEVGLELGFFLSLVFPISSK